MSAAGAVGTGFLVVWLPLDVGGCRPVPHAAGTQPDCQCGVVGALVSERANLQCAAADERMSGDEVDRFRQVLAFKQVET